MGPPSEPSPSTAALPRAREACDRLRGLFERAQAVESRRRTAPDADLAEPLLPFARALLAMRLRPALEEGWLEKDPLHAAVFGGTNTGKSTAINVLLGRAACGMRVTARFSQHPEAFRPTELGNAWCEAFPTRFQGYRRFDGEHPPRQSDEEIRRDGWRRAFAIHDPEVTAPRALAPSVAPEAVLWDAPDFSTEEAQSWLDGVLEGVALAEVVLLVVTNESYADDRGVTLLKMVAGTGCALHVIGNKTGGDRELFADLSKKLTDRGLIAKGSGEASFHPLPQVVGDDPETRLAALLESDDAQVLRGVLGARLAEGRARKLETLRGTVGFLEERFDDLFEGLRLETQVAERWRAVVERVTRGELIEGYREEYLSGKRYPDFDRALVEMVRMLQVPGIGKVLGGIGQVARMPMRWIKRQVNDLVAGPTAKGGGDGPPEERVLARRFKAWLSALRSEAQALSRADGHPSWDEIAAAVDGDAFQGAVVEGFQKSYGEYRTRMDARIEQTAQELYSKIRDNPKLLNALRAAVLGADGAVTVAAVMSGGLSPSDLVIGPLVHAIVEELVEWGLGSIVRLQEESMKRDQMTRIETLCRDCFEAPGRALFVGALEVGELDRARADLSTVRQAVQSMHVGSATTVDGGAR